jgi:hypothetical protein
MYKQKDYCNLEQFSAYFQWLISQVLRQKWSIYYAG